MDLTWNAFFMNYCTVLEIRVITVSVEHNVSSYFKKFFGSTREMKP